MALIAEGLYFTYSKGKKELLNGFSAVFPPGQITALTGPNGCGKTTLTKIMVGILHPSQGNVKLDNQDIAKFSLAETGRHIGYVMQNPTQQLFCTSVYEEMAYGLQNIGLLQTEIAERIEHYLAYFELLQHKYSLPFQLSYGEKQRLVLAVILAMRPQYLILDEPTAALDVYRRRILGELLQKIAYEDGCGIMLVSHDAEFVKRYAACEIKMTGGRRCVV